MRLAEHAHEVLAKANSDAHFTIDAALATISKPKSKSEELVAPLLHGPCANGEALAALRRDLAEIHSRGSTGRILQAITMVMEIGITPSAAAGVVIRTGLQENIPTLRKSAATAADIAVAWLRDFIRELERPPNSRRTGRPRLVLSEVPEGDPETSA